nr:MAG: Hom-end-associated Hint [Bacteriophage sp.]
MIDFSKKIKNSNKFRTPALSYLESGSYCAYPKDTTEYYNFWDREVDRCINGFTAEDGDFITGYHYFYLNYCPILRIVWKDKKRTSEKLFPDFYDYDYYFFQSVEEAEKDGEHMCVSKSRRKGFSYKAASMACRNFFLIPDSKTYIYASNKQYLTEDGILTKAWDYMNFIDECTAWGKKRQTADTNMRKRASMLITDEYGNKIEVGYKSEIIGVSLKDNPDVGHPYSQAVYTPEGKKLWKDITVGSELFTPTGEITKVSEVHELGEVDIYEFTLSDGRTVESTEDHKWEVIRRGYKRKNENTGENYRTKIFSTKEIYELTQNSSYKSNMCRLSLPKCVSYNFVETPIDAYTMGLLLGDGCFSKSTCNRVCITQSVEDMNEIKKFIPYEINKQDSKRNVDYEILIPNAKQIFQELGLYDKRSGSKFIPDCYKYNSEEVRLAVLNGLLDTDGSVTKDYGVIEYVSKSKALTEDTAWLCRSLGINCKIATKLLNGTTYYRLYIYLQHNDFRLFKLSRKKERLNLKKNNNFANCKRLSTFIVSAKIVRKEISKCVTVEHPQHKYLIGDFIPTKNCRGKRGKLIIFEEAGSFPELGAAWQIARPSVEQDGMTFGLMLAFGTGGDEGPAISALRDMFYHPKSYNCKAFPNIWDEGAKDTTCGFFVPQYTNLDNRDEDGNRIYMDNDGNTIYNKSLDYILTLREENTKDATNSKAIDRYVAERCICPAEAFMEFSGNIFPKKELQKQLAHIRTNKKLKNFKQVGDLQMVDNRLVWNLKKTGDILEYPLPNTADPTGSIVIWEHPVIDAPYGLYIASLDSYDQDQSGTNSLGSCFIYKRFQDFESYSDIIVAEYTGRPKTAEMFYENVRKLLMYYNAKVMVENQNPGIFAYFNNKHCDYLLADQPDIIKDITNNSKVNRSKGCHMTKEIKLWGEGKIKEWLEEDIGNGKLRLNTILSEPLLEELIKYNDKGNFDRVMSMIQLMIYKEQLYNTQVKQKQEIEKKQRLFDVPIFTDKWFEQDTSDSTNKLFDSNILTFSF